MLRCARLIYVRVVRRRYNLYQTTVIRKSISSATSTSVVTSTKDVSPEEIVEYPPVRQKYPPGSWGGMSPFFAWHWHNRIQSHMAIPTIQGRLRNLTPLTHTWISTPFANEPYILDYQQYVTKTKLVEGMPDFYTSIDVNDEFDYARSLISETLLHDLWYTDITRRYTSDYDRNRLLNRDVIGNIIQSLAAMLSGKCEYLARSHYDEDVRIEATWDRFGFKGRLPNNKNKLYKDDKTYVIELRHDSRFYGTHLASVLLRTEKPLQQILALDHELCSTCTYPIKRYWPGAIGQPHAHRPGANIPGHKLGDPCEFGQLGVLVTSRCNHNIRCFNDDVVDEIEIGAGLMSGFNWLVAQAHFQGFSTYVDVTCPFCAQTIVTDGRHMRFFTSQLNTLLLWKDNEANPVQNLCWYSPKLSLYDRVENGQVIGLNDEAVRWLLKFLMNEPKEMEAETALPATYVRPRDVGRFIDEKVTEIIIEEEEQLYD